MSKESVSEQQFIHLVNVIRESNRLANKALSIRINNKTNKKVVRS